MNNNCKIVLYHANWCGHCIRFMPEWQRLKQNFTQFNDGQNNTILVNYENYEDTSNKEQISEARVTGFPTIHIKFNGLEEYKGERNADAIARYIKSKVGSNNNHSDVIESIIRKSKYNNNNDDDDDDDPFNDEEMLQEGGKKNSNYDKYLKYKAKYLKLKKMLQKKH